MLSEMDKSFADLFYAAHDYNGRAGFFQRFSLAFNFQHAQPLAQR